jgi:hypothetical protein
MRCADCGRFWYSSGARRMLRDDDRCPACEGRLELADIGDAEPEQGARSDRAEGGTRNG